MSEDAKPRVIWFSTERAVSITLPPAPGPAFDPGPCLLSADHAVGVAAWADGGGSFQHIGCREPLPNALPVLLETGRGTRCTVCKNEFG